MDRGHEAGCAREMKCVCVCVVCVQVTGVNEVYIQLNYMLANLLSVQNALNGISLFHSSTIYKQTPVQ